MIMADVLKIFLLIVGLMSVFVCYWLSAVSLAGSFVEKARMGYRERPVRITLVGALCAAPLLLFGLVLFENLSGHPLAAVLGSASLMFPVLFGLVGSAGLCTQIGIGLFESGDQLQPWRRTRRGGIVLTFVFLLPFLGWFVILPWTLVSGFGASIYAYRELRKDRRAPLLQSQWEVPAA